jgi:hypothetical protein
VHDAALVELQVSVELLPPATEVGLAVSVAVGTGAMVTVADAVVLVPPAPVHISEYVVLAVKAPVLWVPLTAFAPVQPPEAVHDVEFVELQVSVEDAPPAIGLGLAVSVAVGTGAMVTVADAVVLVPPAPVHVNEYVVLAVKAPVLWLPLLPCVPANVPPVAMHDVALVELQVNVDVPPLAMLVGFAFNVAVGMAPIVTVAVAGALVPPAPVHVNEYAVLVVKAPVLWLPLAVFVPLQPPDAIHDVAWVELHVNREAPPLAMVVGLAVSVAVGAGAMLTVAVAGVLVPPAPVHVNEYVVLAVKAPVLWLPLAVFVPANVPPAALQDVALVELQVSMEVPLLATLVGFAFKVAVGIVPTVTVAVTTELVPPGPVHVSE